MIHILEPNCKVIWCPANYKSLVRTKIFNPEKYKKLPHVDKEYVQYLTGIRSCGAVPNPYLNYKKQAVWCYNMLKYVFPDIGLQQAKKNL